MTSENMHPTSQVILVSMYARGIRVTTDRRVGEGGREGGREGRRGREGGREGRRDEQDCSR